MHNFEEDQTLDVAFVKTVPMKEKSGNDLPMLVKEWSAFFV
jgi:hypothetical protein